MLPSLSVGLGASIDPLRDNPQDVAIGVNSTDKLNKKPAVRARQFKPRLEDSGRFELSTYCVDQLDEQGRWELLEKHVKPLVARAELGTHVFRDAGLTVDPDWDPERHINIVDWPEDEEARNSIAQLIHDKQRPFVRPV